MVVLLIARCKNHVSERVWLLFCIQYQNRWLVIHLLIGGWEPLSTLPFASYLLTYPIRLKIRSYRIQSSMLLSLLLLPLR